MIYLGADHRGFELKQKLFQRLKDEGMMVSDLGNDHLDPNDDYPDFAEKVAEATVSSLENKGILLCGSGVGVDMVANKVPGVRAALVDDVTVARQSREHEDVNVISLPADVLDEEEAWNIIKIFLSTPFSGDERHIRRLEEVKDIEEKHAK
ncbi:MAG: RpiB/LacA/LacB family sugar-phosphate isomerase [Candidatus Daviesbacteria bacterium]|nr:RpiB/LacA/LacB family sugar-phosphate isomerase [Candidatus Daviesbacteria bacterium]